MNTLNARISMDHIPPLVLSPLGLPPLGLIARRPLMSGDDKPGNRLLAALPPDDWRRMRAKFDRMELRLGNVIFEQNAPLRRLYFPLSGVISTVAMFENGSVVEMATTGPEGMVAALAILGDETASNRQLVQVGGAALVVRLEDFRRFAAAIPSFRRILLAYAQAFQVQTLQSVACNGVHSLEERAARWLLTCHDRSDSDTFFLTQEFLAEMLGVSRPAVSAVARTLQQRGMIRYARGTIAIRNRNGLERASCECYRIIRQDYARRLARVLEENGHPPA